nr:hypothetical protein [Tanacetum cinerariifolium]
MAAKISHFEILCRVYGFVPTVRNFHRDRVVSLVGVNDQGNQNEVVQDEGIDIMRDDEVQAIVANKPKKVRKKRKAADDAGGSGLPPKILKEDHGGNFPVEVGVTTVATLLFITSFVSLTPEREGGGHTDSVTVPNLCTLCAAERFVVLSNSSHHSSTNAADDKVTFIVRSSMPPPHVLTAPSQFLTVFLEIPPLQERPTKMLQTYIPKWNVTNDSALDDPDISLEEEKGALESKVVVLKTTDATIVAELASLTAQVEKDRLVDQVSSIEGICSELRDEVMGYKLFKEQIEVVQDEQGLLVMIDKGMHDGLAAGIDYGKAERVLTNVAAYNPFTEVDFIFVMNALPYASHSSSEDQVIFRETPLSFYLDVVHSYKQRIRGDVTSQHLSIIDDMVFLIEPLSAENLIGKTSTSEFSTMTTALSTTFVQTSFVPLISAVDLGVLSAEQPTKVPSPPKIVFEKEELDTTPEHTTAD